MILLLYVFNILLLVGLSLWLKKQSWSSEIGRWFYPALFFKLAAGVFLGLLYQHYYGTGDTLAYFKASLKLTNYFFENPSGYFRLLFLNEFESEAFRESIPFSKYAYFSNSFFLLKIISLLNLLTGSSYFLVGFYFSLFSFWGAARLAATLARCFPGTRTAAIIAFLFFPSIVFWSSGLLKDSIMMGSMCWLAAFVIGTANGQPLKLREFLLAFMMLYLFVRIKLFIAAALLPVLLVYWVLQRLAVKMPVLRAAKVSVGILAGTVGATGILVGLLFNALMPNYLFRQVVHSHNIMLGQSQNGPHIAYDKLEPTLPSVAANAPEALFSAVYRPFIGESVQPLYLLVSLENLLLLVLTLLLLFSWFSKKQKFTLHLLFAGFVLFCVVAGIMIGLSTPNFGSLSRYRIAFLPFLVYLLLQSYYVKALLHRVSKWSN